MKYEGVSFNVEAVLKHSSAEDFSMHLSFQHLWKKLTAEKRRERLVEVYNIIKFYQNANSK